MKRSTKTNHCDRTEADAAWVASKFKKGGVMCRNSAAAHVRQSLAKDGTWMIVEPFANDQLKDNLNPVGRVYYSFSTLLCTPCSRSQEVGMCLGAQAGETRIREVVTSAGFNRFRRATETPFNIVYEARP